MVQIVRKTWSRHLKETPGFQLDSGYLKPVLQILRLGINAACSVTHEDMMYFDFGEVNYDKDNPKTWR